MSTIIKSDPAAHWIVTGGDDVLPDPNHTAQEIGLQCLEHFGGTFGVMQPTGDRWGEDGTGLAASDRLCYSPFMGREFCRRMYGGSGPLFSGYVHMFVDEELQEVALKLDCLWQRRDLIHKHEHWARDGGEMPRFLYRANTREHWDQFQSLFQRRKASGFPGHEPIAA